MKQAAIALGQSERGKITYVLIAVVLLSVVYPFSELGTVPALLFVFIYLGLLGSGIYLVSSNRTLFYSTVGLTIVIAICGVITILSDFTSPLWIQLLWGLSLLLYQGLIIFTLVVFIIESDVVTVEVLYAAVTIYFLVAATFGAIYGAIEITAPGSFISSSGAEITWQRLAYFSYVTITTLGYGDIVPVAPTAQSVSALEASVGTLYIAILIGRFVSLYQQGAQKKAI